MTLAEYFGPPEAFDNATLGDVGVGIPTYCGEADSLVPVQPSAVPRSCSTLLRRAARCRIPTLDVLGPVTIVRRTFYPSLDCLWYRLYFSIYRA